MVHLLKTYFNTTKGIDIYNATHDTKRALVESKVLQGILTVFISTGTAGVVLLENDPVLREDFRELVALFVPERKGDRPQRKSGTGNNDAHLRATLLGKSVVLPIKDGRLLLGAWQEVIAFDFDDKAGRTEICFHVMGEGAEPKK